MTSETYEKFNAIIRGDFRGTIEQGASDALLGQSIIFGELANTNIWEKFSEWLYEEDRSNAEVLKQIVGLIDLAVLSGLVTFNAMRLMAHNKKSSSAEELSENELSDISREMMEFLSQRDSELLKAIGGFGGQVIPKQMIDIITDDSSKEFFKKRKE